MVSPEPLGPEPEPTQDTLDLSGETGAVSDLQGAAAAPDEILPQSTPADLDLTTELPGVPTKDLTITLDHIHMNFEALKILKFGFVVAVKKLGSAVQAAVALCILAVATVLLIYFTPNYVGWILGACAMAGALLILLAWRGGGGGSDN